MNLNWFDSEEYAVPPIWLYQMNLGSKLNWMAHFANWMSRAFHGTLVKLGQDMIEIRFLGYAVFKGNSVFSSQT